METPECLQEKLKKMEDNIDSMDIDWREAYELALFVNSGEYITSEEFCLIFLQADHFDAEAAARQIVRHFDKKVESFVTEKACQPMHFSLDFEEKDSKAIEGGGSLRLFPVRDESGHGILFSYQNMVGLLSREQ